MEYKICMGIDVKAVDEIKEVEAIIARNKFQLILNKMIIKNKFHKGEIF